jgi:sugar O-acyltransferase (sialic acid O-acetyltransferase NeuD family)
MGQWVIFGFGNYLSDVFDIIHSNKGRVKAIVNNIELTDELSNNLKRRVSLLGYDVPLVELGDFRPSDGDLYCYGFVRGRDKLTAVVKRAHGIEFSPLVHPAAYMGSNARYGEGVIIGPNATIAPNCKIGDFCLISRAASIGHDTEIGEYTVISPGVSIAGMVEIERDTMLGIGSTVIDGIRIGSNSIVGAGAVVVSDVPDNVVVVGVPAKVLRKNE